MSYFLHTHMNTLTPTHTHIDPDNSGICIQNVVYQLNEWYNAHIIYFYIFLHMIKFVILYLSLSIQLMKHVVSVTNKSSLIL